MFNLGLFELVLLLIIGLIILGPEKLPQTMRQLGKWYAILLHAKNKLTHNMLSELQLLETQEQLKKELSSLRQSEQAIKAQMQSLQGAIRQNQTQILHLYDDIDPPPINPLSATPSSIQPMTGQFFLLGDYDKRRRLPPAPRLPNYQADRLQLITTND